MLDNIESGGNLNQPDKAHFLDRVSREMDEDLGVLDLSPRKALAPCLGLLLALLAFPCAAVTAAEVIDQNRSLEPMMCEALKLEGEMAEVIRNSGVPVQEIMRRDINEDSPVIRSIKRITQRIQGLVDANLPAITRVKELEQKLSPEEREKLDAYLRGMMQKCLPR